MTGVLGETIYQTTGWLHANTIVAESGGNHTYCGGCNGSFVLDFTQSSPAQSPTVGPKGVGFDFTGLSIDYRIITTLSDGNVVAFDPTPVTPGINGFFGIWSEAGIDTIHVGGVGKATLSQGSIQIDNLMIGVAVPEPAAALLQGFSLLTVALLSGRSAARRRARVSRRALAAGAAALLIGGSSSAENVSTGVVVFEGITEASVNPILIGAQVVGNPSIPGGPVGESIEDIISGNAMTLQGVTDLLIASAGLVQHTMGEQRDSVPDRQLVERHHGRPRLPAHRGCGRCGLLARDERDADHRPVPERDSELVVSP